MLAFIARRLLAALPVLAMVAVIVFLLMRLTAGDPAAILAGDAASPAQVEEIRKGLGLDRPIPVQFGLWLVRLLQGDLGRSFFFKRPVAELIAQRLGTTLTLAAAAMLVSVVIAVPLGVLAAWCRGTLVDRVVMVLVILGFSVPVFVLGYLLIWLFAVRLDWLPVQGFRPLGAGLGPFLSHLVLPCTALATVYVALIARITRASMLEVLGEDYIRTARAKGLGEGAVLFRHALRNAAVPVVTVIGLGLGLLIGGVVVTESVFNIPGLGRLTVEAVLGRDYPTIQGVILVFSLLYVLLNLVVDLTYGLLDPRIRQ